MAALALFDIQLIENELFIFVIAEEVDYNVALSTDCISNYLRN